MFRYFVVVFYAIKCITFYAICYRRIYFRNGCSRTANTARGALSGVMSFGVNYAVPWSYQMMTQSSNVFSGSYWKPRELLAGMLSLANSGSGAEEVFENCLTSHLKVIWPWILNCSENIYSFALYLHWY